MKKYLWLLLCLFLVGCKDKKDEKEDTHAEATYLYDYALSINTYESLMDIKTNYLSVENNTKHFEYVFKTNETDEVFENVTVTIQIKTKITYIDIGDQYETQEYETTFSGKNHSYIIEYPETHLLYDYQIISITGNVKTNKVYTNIEEMAESNKTYLSLKNSIDGLNQTGSTKMSIKQQMIISNGYQSETTLLETNIDTENFYFSSIVNGETGAVILFEDGEYNLYTYLNTEFGRYLQLEDSFQNDDQIDLSETETNFKFDPSWQYTYREGVYTIKATLEDIIKLSVSDPSLVNQLIGGYNYTIVSMKLEIKDLSMTMDISYEISSIKITLKTEYLFNSVSKINLEDVKHTASIKANLLKTKTDLSLGVTNELYIPSYKYYYLVDFKEGVYALEKDFLLNLTLYDTNYSEVILTKPESYANLDRHPNLYQIEEGTYIVEVWYYTSEIGFYDLKFNPLSETYNDLIDLNNPLVQEDAIVTVDIEGKYDMVIYEFDSIHGASLTIESDDLISQQIDIYEYDTLRDYKIFKNTMYLYTIFLNEGKNYLVFSSEKSSSQTYRITYFAHHPKNGLLPNEYDEDYTYSSFQNKLTYDFEITEPSVVTFSEILHESSDPEVIFYKLSKKIGNPYIAFTSVKAGNSQKVYLNTGIYQVTVNGDALIKLKGTIESMNAIYDYEASISSIDQLSISTLIDKDTYPIYTQYPFGEQTITFTIDEAKDILIDSYAFGYDYNYVLLDSNGKRLNYPNQRSFAVYHLKAGTYYIKPNRIATSNMVDIQVLIAEVLDETIKADEAPFDPYMPNWINVGDSISVINNFKGDVELFQFSVTSQSYVLIESTNAYCFVYDESGNRITESYDDTYRLTTGNYIVLLQYQDYSTGINPTLALSYN